MDWRLFGGLLMGAGVNGFVLGFALMWRTPECPPWLRRASSALYAEATVLLIVGGVLVWSV